MTEYSGTKPPHPAHKEVLVFDIKGRPSGVAVQVSLPTYEHFKHLESQRDLNPNIPNIVLDYDERIIIEMLNSIKEWERRTKEELAAFDRHDEAKALAASIFD